MASVLATLVALAVIGLLFALDPDGAIARSGFPDFRDMDWTQLTAWGFRTIGVAFALLLVLGLWLRFRPRQRIRNRYSSEAATWQRLRLPAAAVSVLEDRKVSGRTLLAAIVEMCQRGALQFECVETGGGYRYLLSRNGAAQFDWEWLIFDNLPSRPTTVQALHDAISEHEDAIGDRVGDYLQRQGLFRDNPIREWREKNGEGTGWALLAGILMGVGSGFWLALWLPQWWATSLAGIFIGFIFWLIAMPMNAGMLQPTEAGAQQIAQVLGLKESLPGPDQAGGRDESDSTLAYAVALDVAQPWLNASVAAPPWIGSAETDSQQAPNLDSAYRGFISAPAWGLTGRSGDVAEAAAKPNARREAARPQSRRPRPEQAERTATSEGVGCFTWVVRLLGIAALFLAVVVGINLFSPAVEPCPNDSPPILPEAQVYALLDVLLDECVSVVGEVVGHDVGELVVEMDRGEYVQWVNVLGPEEVLERASMGDTVRVTGRIREHEDVGYMVQHGVDRGRWGNLRENLPGDFFTP